MSTTSTKATEAEAASSSSAPHDQGHGASSSATSLTIHHKHHHHDNAPKIEESDEEDLFTVPDVGDDEDEHGTEDSPKNSDLQLTNNSGASVKRRRGRNPVDRECRRLKRLLRNRVSAQQARERKKVYVHDMESKAQQLMESNSKLEEKISTLVNENAMLRKILMNTRPKTDESSEPTKDLLP